MAELSPEDALRPLRMQVDRLAANRTAITGWDGDETMLDGIVAALREQLDWLESEGLDQIVPFQDPDALYQNDGSPSSE